MFTPEQEQQLTEWGCPRESEWDTDPETGYTNGHTTDTPRQPHDVLAWLARNFDAGVGLTLLYHDGNDQQRQWQASSSAYGWSTPHPDPYSAVYALAQAVMVVQQ